MIRPCLFSFFGMDMHVPPQEETFWLPFFLPAVSAVKVIESVLSVHGCVCVGFVEATMFTTATIQSYVVHHGACTPNQGSLCTLSEKNVIWKWNLHIRWAFGIFHCYLMQDDHHNSGSLRTKKRLFAKLRLVCYLSNSSFLFQRMPFHRDSPDWFNDLFRRV